MPRQVLVIDSDPGVRAVMCDILEDAGFSAAAAPLTAAEGLVRDVAGGALLILEVVPGVAFRPLVDLAGERGVRILLMTGDPRCRALVEESGHPFLFKPFHVAELVRLVEAALRSAES